MLYEATKIQYSWRLNINFKLLFLLLAFGWILDVSKGAMLALEEANILARCLRRFGGLNEDNAERLQRYKSWSDNYEEIPCFTNCYIASMFDFYSEAGGFDTANVTKYFGQPLYSACSERLTRGASSCERAYNGFHCLVKLEDDPNVLIESMEHINDEAKTAMKECLHKFEPSEWQHLKDYKRRPVTEPLPCYTKCFLDRLQAFNVAARQWNAPAMARTLGLTEQAVNSPQCVTLKRFRDRNSCKWMFREFTCFSMA